MPVLCYEYHVQHSYSILYARLYNATHVISDYLEAHPEHEKNAKKHLLHTYRKLDVGAIPHIDGLRANACVEYELAILALRQEHLRHHALDSVRASLAQVKEDCGLHVALGESNRLILLLCEDMPFRIYGSETRKALNTSTSIHTVIF